MKGKYWLTGWLIIVCVGLGVVGGWVYKIDPYMHYHKPDTDRYFYTLDNQRSQNDGIIKHFDYDALITGTSMTENFKTSEMDEIFECNSIKVSYSGGSYKEINNSLENAVRNNPDLKIVVRGLDMGKFFDDKNAMREDLGEYPTYLYDSNPVNDVQYIWNRDVIWNRAYPMTVANNMDGFRAGVTSFDEYSRWQYWYEFGVNSFIDKETPENSIEKSEHLTTKEKETIRENITQNVTSLAKANPNITFYYFFTPYSVVWWKKLVADETIYKQIEAEEYIIKLILECDNIKLFSFNNRLDITSDLNNYKDSLHYGQWINSLILRWMHDGEYQLTKDNYKEYLEEELNNYLTFNYDNIYRQNDYESDFYAAALLNEELTGARPINVLSLTTQDLNLNGASIIPNQHNGNIGIKCVGSLKREAGSNISTFDYILNEEYIGARVNIHSVDDYRYLVFYGKKVSDHGQPTVYVIDSEGVMVGEVTNSYQNLDNEWHQYVIDITQVKGDIQIIFNGGYVDNTGCLESDYIFSDIMLY